MEFSKKFTLVRTNDNMAIHRCNEAPAGKIELSNITWHIPKYQLCTAASVEQIAMSVARLDLLIYFSARSSRIVNGPTGTTTFEWPLSVSTCLKKPRWVIVGLQTELKHKRQQSLTIFD